MIEKKLQGSREMPNGGDVEDALGRVLEAFHALEATWETTSELLEHHVLGRHFKADKVISRSPTDLCLQFRMIPGET